MKRKTTIVIWDEELWRWARKRAIDLGMGTGRYIFKLIEKDRRGEVIWRDEEIKGS